MPDTSQALTHNGTRGWREPPGPSSCADLRLIARALEKEWGVTPEERQRCRAEAMKVFDLPHATTFHKLAAIKVMALIDGIDAKREATEVRAATPPQTINIFGDVSQYAGVFGEQAPPIDPPVELPARPIDPPQP
jgi:hypothetical protein